MQLSAQSVLDEIDSVLKDAQEHMSVVTLGDFGPEMEVALASEAFALLTAAIHRYSWQGSGHAAQLEDACDAFKKAPSRQRAVETVLGILKAIRRDYETGRTRKYEELLRADTFSDYLEMALHLLDEGYKDPAAVLAGSTLEAHLKALGQKLGVSVTFDDAKGKRVHKKADTVSADLVKANAYHANDHKAVIAWLGMRNDAAHGDYAKYEAASVRLLIESVRDFMRRCPA
jgi:hypothetical protein